MQMRNSVTLIGNLGQDPETITTAKGRFITRFRLATNEYYRDKEGKRQTRTQWHQVVSFGKLAETMRDNLSKGQQIALTGSIRYDQWTDKFEQKRVSTEIIVDEFTYLSRKATSATQEKVESESTVV